ncbi:MAG: aldo/keto reductase [Candidatus Cloacimonadota bacterium]|nr:aldo/keto reductase [Candidatus Cloacimonadota bacterium]
MQYRKLCGEEVSILGFGTMRFPVIDKNYKKIDKQKAEEMLDHAIEKGVNYLDTAKPYHRGESEKFVGRYLKKQNLRDKIFLATKLPAWLIKEEADFDKQFNDQLEKLQTDYFDFYLLHALNTKSWQNIKDLGVLKWCEKKKAEGKIKHIGFSFHDSYSVFKEIVDAYDKWEFCQLQYNYMDLEFQAGEKGFKYALENNIEIIVMEPLRGGQLSKVPPLEIEKLWQKFPVKRSYADGALQWVWNKKQVPILLSGMTTMQHVKENIESAKTAKIGIYSKKELALFKAIRTAYLKRSPFFCTTCKYCQPCPHGVDISSVLGFYMMNVMYDDLKRSKMFYSFLAEENRADKCVECGECEPKCPQQIEIIKWLKESHKILKKD